MKLSDYNNYNGIDVSNEISLYEYGLLVSKTVDTDNQYHVVFGVSVDDSGNYDAFDTGWVSESEIDQLLTDKNTWVEVDKFVSYIDISLQEWLDLSIVNKLSDLIQYYGCENILGSCYSSMLIENDEN